MNKSSEKFSNLTEIPQLIKRGRPSPDASKMSLLAPDRPGATWNFLKEGTQCQRNGCLRLGPLRRSQWELHEMKEMVNHLNIKCNLSLKLDT